MQTVRPGSHPVTYATDPTDQEPICAMKDLDHQAEMDGPSDVWIHCVEPGPRYTDSPRAVHRPFRDPDKTTQPEK